MLNHHIQKGIVYRLSLQSPLRFSELKPDELENKLFNYHLKIVMSLGLVSKDNNGLYILTSKGKKLGIHAYENISDIFKRALSILLIAVKNEDSWLMSRRLNEPLKGLVGFKHCEPEAGIKSEIRAHNFLLETSGLDATFKVAGSGIYSTFFDQEIENFVNFTVLLANTTSWNLPDSTIDNYMWVKNIEINYLSLVPSMQDIITGLETNELFYLDKKYDLNIS